MASENYVSQNENIQMTRSWSNTFFGWVREISVEPVLFLHNIASQVVWIASQDLMIEKACKVNLRYGDDICNNLNQHKEYQERVQDLVSKFSMWRSIFETSIKVIFTLFLGSWSDRWGRRLPLIMCLSGLLLESVFHLINSQMPSWSLETILISSVPYSLGGGVMALLMLCFAHLADTSKARRRTLRMGFLDSSYYIGGPVGNLIVGPLLDAGGYWGGFSLSIGVYLITIIYVMARIFPVKSVNHEIEARAVCDVTRLTDAVAVTVKPRPNRATLHIVLLIMAMLCDSLPVIGEMSLRYLFTKLALNWTHTSYSHWSAFASILSTLTMIVVIPILSVLLGMPDSWMGFLGGISRTVSSSMYGFVSKPSDAWLMWAGGVVASIKNMAPVSIRSLLSKLAGQQDVGKVYAVMATAEALIEFAAAPMYNAVYIATNDTKPGTFFFLSAGFNLGIVIILLVVSLSMKKIKKDDYIGETLPTSEEQSS